MYKYSKVIKAKHSNTLDLVVHYANDDGSDMDLTLFTIKSFIKNNNKEIVLVPVVYPIDLAKGKFELLIGELPIALTGLYIDIRLEANGKTFNNDIIKLDISEVVTDA